jgi:hypothetical protein
MWIAANPTWHIDAVGGRLHHQRRTDLIQFGMNLRARTKQKEARAICDGVDEVRKHHMKHTRRGKGKGSKQVLHALDRKQVPA